MEELTAAALSALTGNTDKLKLVNNADRQTAHNRSYKVYISKQLFKEFIKSCQQTASHLIS
jgi:hypothetical protein